jgi:hypothetical protein
VQRLPVGRLKEDRGMKTEIKEERAAEQRPYISQWWVVDADCEPMLYIMAGPFNKEEDAYGELSGPRYRTVETRHPIYQPWEE